MENRGHSLQIILIILLLIYILPIFAEDTGSSTTVEACQTQCGRADNVLECAKKFTCATYDDQCLNTLPESSSSRTVWYSNGQNSNSKSYDSIDYMKTNKNSFIDYTTTHFWYRVSDGCGDYCCCGTPCPAQSSSASPPITRECQPWQECSDDRKNINNFPVYGSGFDAYYTEHDGFYSIPTTGCPGGEDGSTGCKCNDQYCKGWCMDNAPVYDGYSSCTDYSANYAELQRNPLARTTCEYELGGTCSGTGKRLYINGGPGSTLCPSGSICTSPENAKCEDLGGKCKEVDSSISATSKLGHFDWAYCDQPLVKNLPEEDKKYRVVVPAGGSDVEGSLCPENQDCCVPKKADPDASDIEKYKYNEKYTLVPDPRETETKPGRTYVDCYEPLTPGSAQSKLGDDGIELCVKAKTDYLTSAGGLCYCNYLAIKDFYECEDTRIDDSHPCMSGNCATDFIGGQNFCCPSAEHRRTFADGRVYLSNEKGCAHLDISGKPVLCWSSKDKSWKDCSTVKVFEPLNFEFPAYKKNSETDPLSCYTSGAEILYDGTALTCDDGQWRVSQGCGETIFNYELKSESQPKTDFSQMAHPCTSTPSNPNAWSDYYDYCIGFADPSTSFSNTPISYKFSFDRPKDAIAYAIPKTETNDAVKIIAKSVTEQRTRGRGSYWFNEIESAKTEVTTIGQSGKKILAGKTGTFEVSFAGKNDPETYNLTVDCYTPDKSFCYSEAPDCYPQSYCVEDSPTSIASPSQVTCQVYDLVKYGKPPGQSSGQDGWYTNQVSVLNDTCYYCCPKGYCAHKVSGSAANEIKTPLETADPIKPEDDTQVLVMDSAGNEISTISWKNFQENPVSVCAVDSQGILKFPKIDNNRFAYCASNLQSILDLSTHLAAKEYIAAVEELTKNGNLELLQKDCLSREFISSITDPKKLDDNSREFIFQFIDYLETEYPEKDYLCKYQIAISGSNSFDMTLLAEGRDWDHPISDQKETIMPSTYGKWSVGERKEFLVYDKQGDLINPELMIESGVAWSDGIDGICKRISRKEYGLYEAVGEGDCKVDVTFTGGSATFTQRIAAVDSTTKIISKKTVEPNQPDSIECYPPGTHKLGQGSEQCNWICMDGVWGKGMSGQPCETECDCNLGSETAENKLSCLEYPTKAGKTGKTCCKAGQCANLNSCVAEGDKTMVGGVLSVCSKGEWLQSGIVTKSSYERTVLSEKNPTKEVTLQITKNDIGTDKDVSATLHTFFEKGNYAGNIVITPIDSNGKDIGSYPGDINLGSMEVSIPSSKIPVTYKARISTNPVLKDEKYIIYLGSTLVVEVLD